MSCSSPFKAATGYTYGEQVTSTGFTGSCSIPGYTLPSEKVCLWVWVPTSWDCKCLGGCVCKKWKWCKCCTKICYPDGGELVPETCWSTPSVGLFPNLTIDYALSVPMTYEIAVGESVSASGSPSGYITNKIIITDFDFNFSVNGEGFNVNVPTSVTISETGGSFSTTYLLSTLDETYTADGFVYKLAFTFNLLGCLVPTPPEGWLNIQVVLALSVSYSDNVGESIYSCNVAAVCPIVSVED